MKTPREIHISTKGVMQYEIDLLIELLDNESYLNYRLEENKINIFFIKTLEVALWIMYYLEKNCWGWSDYYK